MKTYEHFANRISELLGGERCVRIHSDGFMPLVIEDISFSPAHRKIAISHTTTQNGDLMRDPEIVFDLVEVGDTRLAEPVSFRDDFSGLRQEVYDYDETGRRTRIRPHLKTELRCFARTWFRNLRDQGFFDRSARREHL